MKFYSSLRQIRIVAYVLLSAACYGDTLQYLQAPLVKSEIELQWTDANKALVSVDGHDLGYLAADQIFLTKDVVQITYPGLNPLRYRLKSTAKAQADPMAAITTQLRTALGSVLGLIAPGSTGNASTARLPACGTAKEDLDSIKANLFGDETTVKALSAMVDKWTAGFDAGVASTGPQTIAAGVARIRADVKKISDKLDAGSKAWESVNNCVRDFPQLEETAQTDLTKAKAAYEAADKAHNDAVTVKTAAEDAKRRADANKSQADADKGAADRALDFATGALKSAQAEQARVSSTKGSTAQQRQDAAKKVVDAQSQLATAESLQKVAVAAVGPAAAAQTLAATLLAAATARELELGRPLAPGLALPTVKDQLDRAQAIVPELAKQREFYQSIKLTAKPDERIEDLTKFIRTSEEIAKALELEFGLATRWKRTALVNYIASEPLSPTFDQMQAVTVVFSSVALKLDADTGVLSTKLTELNTTAFTVRKYDPWAPEISAAVVFGTITRPEYGTSVNTAGQTVVADASSQTVSVSPSILVNFVSRWGGRLRPMGQIGVAASRDVPAILTGAGIRLFSAGPGDIAISGGAMFAWYKDLQKLKIGSVVSGTADIEADKGFITTPKIGGYFALQYKF